MTEIKTRIPENAFAIVNELVKRGYYSSVADFARQSMLDKLINDFEIGISELEPEITRPKQKKGKKGALKTLTSRTTEDTKNAARQL